MHTTPAQDLAFIRRFMDDSRRAVSDRGTHLIIWGVVSALGLVATYARATAGVGPDTRWTWAALLALGWAASLVAGWVEGRSARVSTLARRVLTATGVSTGVTLTLIGLAGLFGGLVDVRALPGLLSVVLAASIFATSLLTGERWLAGVAVCWWVGGAVMLVVPGIYTLLLMAAMAVLLMALPGVVLRLKSGRAHGEAATGDVG